jgi:hypothetical protein
MHARVNTYGADESDRLIEGFESVLRPERRVDHLVRPSKASNTDVRVARGVRALAVR